MIITFRDKIKTLLEVYKCLSLLPFKYKIYILFKPMESTRYTEFAYLLKFLKKNINLNFKNILDISSPFIMAYILSKNSFVTKTDIYEKEKVFIKEYEKLSFQIQNATNFTYKDNQFDFVYSISVIEHIYNNYLTAITEMIRVVKENGYIYLTFPVSKKYNEEWLDTNIYSNQKKNKDKTFFQYLFDEKIFREIIDNLQNVEIILCSIYWEKGNGLYNRYISKIRYKLPFFFLNFIKDSILHFYYGFSLLKSNSDNFKSASSFGNVSLILKKINTNDSFY